MMLVAIIVLALITFLPIGFYLKIVSKERNE